MEMTKRLLGAEHPDTLTSIANLASTFQNQGRWNEAEQLKIQVMEMRVAWCRTSRHPHKYGKFSSLILEFRKVE